MTESHKIIAKHYANLLGDSMRFHNKDTDDWRNAQGMIGEVALAQMLDCLPKWRRHKDETSNIKLDWDGGFDLESRGHRIDCKVVAFRNSGAIERLGLFVGDHGGCDLYVLMLINENELHREKGLDSIDWIDKIWCAGWIDRKSITQRQNGKLRFPVRNLRHLNELSQ